MARRARCRHPQRDGPREPAAHPARQGAGRTIRNPGVADGQPRDRAGSQDEPPPRTDGVHMEVRPSYKQTEVGGIPEDWEVQPLSKLTHQIIDGTHHTPRYVNSGVPFLRVTDIQHSEIDFSDLKFISPEEHQLLKRRCNPEKGDFLLSKNGTIGIPKIVAWDWEFSIFVSLALLKLKTKCLSARYLYQFFKSDYLSDQIRRRSKQGTVT